MTVALCEKCACVQTGQHWKEKKILKYCNIHVIERIKTSICKNLYLHVMISQGKSKEHAGGGNTEQ